MPQSESPLTRLLDLYRATSRTKSEKGTYFEKLTCTYLRYEASYADVWLYSDWAKEQGLDARNTGIDLVVKTRGTDEFHAIQCKCYAENYHIRKSDIDSFFTASGQNPSPVARRPSPVARRPSPVASSPHRLIVTTSNNWSDNADKSISGITRAKGWTKITPDKHYDWMNQRDESFEKFIRVGDKKNQASLTIFENYSGGVKTQRDTCCYSFSLHQLESKIAKTMAFYTSELKRYKNLTPRQNIESFLDHYSTKITWTRALKWDFEKKTTKSGDRAHSSWLVSSIHKGMTLF